jgi:hypothetical protein
MLGFDNKALQKQLFGLLGEMWSKSNPIAKHPSAVDLANSKFNLEQKLSVCAKADDYHGFYSLFLSVPFYKREPVEKSVKDALEKAGIKVVLVDDRASTPILDEEKDQGNIDCGDGKKESLSSPAASTVAKPTSASPFPLGSQKNTVGSAAAPANPPSTQPPPAYAKK